MTIQSVLPRVTYHALYLKTFFEPCKMNFVCQCFGRKLKLHQKYDCHFGKYTTDWCTTTCPKSSLIITGGCCVIWNGIKWYTIKDMCLKGMCMWVCVCETWVWYTILHNQDQSCVYIEIYIALWESMICPKMAMLYTQNKWVEVFTKVGCR